MSHFHALPTNHLTDRAQLHRPTQDLPPRVELNSPAIDVMTDLRKVAAVTIDPSASIAQANDRMIATKVRLLLVIDAEGIVVGLITATDILGERPILHMQQTRKQHEDVTVNDIMTPAHALEVIQMIDVVNARVGNIVATLRREGRQHALVVDFDPHSMRQRVRGIFSTTQIGKQLNMPIETIDKAKSFAELEQAILMS